LKLKQVFLRGALAAALLVLTACSKPSADFTLTFGGDIMLARDGKAIFQNQTKVINPWRELKAEGALINDWSLTPDFFFANLESPLGINNSTTGDMNLCSDPEQMRVLEEGGVDLVSLANNHREDCSSLGAETTQSYLEKQNILSASMGGEPAYVDIPDGKIAIIAAEDVTGSLDVASLLAAIKKAHESASVVVVTMHWGNEYQSGPDERQQSLAQQIADAGADVIWGHHPHVLQKMEWLESADGRQVLVMYSLGNLLADQWMLEEAQRSALVRLSFKDSKINGIEIIPLVIDRSSKTLQLASSLDSRDKIIERLGLNEHTSDRVSIRVFPTEK
jgi:poly-gamma-glutamate capsule biosynthesis protein CapA/YwtB (metallophosphatase superfamily)